MKKAANLITLLTVFFLVSFTPVKETKLIVLDVGHGGNDPGLVINQKQEKEIVMALAKQIKKLNTNENVKIVLTRYKDSYVSLEERVSFINDLKPDLVLSLHTNNSENKEITMFVSKPLDNQTEKMIDKLVSYYPLNLSAVNLKTANFYLLKSIQAPSVMIELGSNYGQNNPTEIAEMILNAIY